MKGLYSLSAGFRIALRTPAVVATMTPSGPAAASKPRLEATLSSDEVDGGRLSAGHGEASCNLLSPYMAVKPRACRRRVSQEPIALDEA